MKDKPSPALPSVEFPAEDIVIGPKAAWVLTIFFLLLLAVPPLLDGLPRRIRELALAVSGRGSHQAIAERLRGYDTSVAAASFTEVPRRLTQQVLTDFLNQGNDRVVMGKDGWLFYRPDIQALTGYGPVEPEPHSVSRDPALLDWVAPLGPILEFGRQLQERGVALWLVPVPMKPSIYPEMLTDQPATVPLRHHDASVFFKTLSASGFVVVQDLANALFAAKAQDPREGPLYLKDDTHWTTRGMGLTADFLAVEVMRQSWFQGLGGPSWIVEKVSSEAGHGDLLEKLGLAVPSHFATDRQEKLAVAKRLEGGNSVTDRASPIVLIGDSFVNIFDDPSLGFAHPDGRTRTGAGLAGNLAARLGIALDVHAVNGEGASGVRRWLAQRGESVVRSKKLVIWVIAERDLFLSRSVAKAQRVNWDYVRFAADLPSKLELPLAAATATVVEAEVIGKSEQADPRRANYENALYTVQYRIRKTLSGPAVSGEVEVVHWCFQKRVLQSTAAVEIGQVYKLILEPWAAQVELWPINRGELGEAAPKWWSAEAERLP